MAKEKSGIGKALACIFAALIYLAGSVVLFTGFDWSIALLENNSWLPFVIAPVNAFVASAVWNGNIAEYGLPLKVKNSEGKTIVNPTWGMAVWATIVAEIVAALVVFAE